MDANDYYRAPSGIGPLAAEWQDKPHRLLYDLAREVEQLQKLLWLRHDPEHYYGLYGDDGEMQCGVCGLDFRRMDASLIESVWQMKALIEAAENPRRNHDYPNRAGSHRFFWPQRRHFSDQAQGLSNLQASCYDSCQ